MVKVNIGHTMALSIIYLDQNGNPMLANPVLDTKPVWTNSTPATETLAPSADGTTAVATTVAVGTDTITLQVASGGKSFNATLAVEVDPAPQVLTSVSINSTVS